MPRMGGALAPGEPTAFRHTSQRPDAHRVRFPVGSRPHSPASTATVDVNDSHTGLPPVG